MKRHALSYAIRLALSSGIVVLAILLLAYALLGALHRRNSDTFPTFSSKNDDLVFVIDAGHGGEDAGAVAEDGTLEKDLNLRIASILRSLCALNGNQAIMTRENDRLLYDLYGDLKDYTGKKKIYDLKNRVRLTREHEGAVLVSIHMNKFAKKQYYGTQVYFSKNNPESESLAREIQARARLYLQPENNRQIKRATSEIFVLDSLDCPAVLVECGFLSNEGELALLKDEEYQAKMAMTIFSAIIS